MTLFHALGPFASSGGVVAAPGMVLVSPTSITHSGTSATLGANGQVTFSAVTSLSLNGVFTSEFDNYMFVVRGTTSAGEAIRFRLRASGSDATGTDYTRQQLQATSTTVNSSRVTETDPKITESFSVQRMGFYANVYGPALAQPTAFRLISATDENSASIVENALTHSLSTSYDGFTVFVNADNMTGALQVYGVRS